VTVRIIQLSDPHFGGEDAAAAEAALAFAAEAEPDLVVVTGDLTLNGRIREFSAASKWLSRLPSPRLVTPGNHDTPYLNLPLRALRPFDRYRRFIGPTRSEAAADGMRAVAFNTARGAQTRPDWSKGAVDLGDLRAVADDLETSGGALRILACHHPLVEVVNTPVTGGVRRGRQAAALVAEGSVDLVLTGHVHHPFAIPLPFGDKKTYAVGASTLSTRLRGAPPGFNLIEADEDSVTVSAMGWTGSAFTPWRTWGLERRTRVSAGS
jgi:3',5'-cyclic AMP phosphodiesterase CpdA